MEVEFHNIKEYTTDLLFIEEFYSSPEFVKQFLKNLNNKGAELGEINNYELVRCINSYKPRGSNGETDIFLSFIENTSKRNLKILIENKINAELRNRQAERYKQRAEKLKKETNTDAITVILAPEKYFPSENKNLDFDFKFTYEEILEIFQTIYSSDEPRSNFKKKLLNDSINKSKEGYVKIEDPNITKFWREYFNYAKTNYSHLGMEEPGSRGPNSFTVNFYPWGNKKIKIVHQMNGKELYLYIPVLNQDIHNKIMSMFSKNQQYTITFEDMTKRKTKKKIQHTKILISTQKIKPSEPFSIYEKTISETLKIANELYENWELCYDSLEMNFNGKSYSL